MLEKYIQQYKIDLFNSVVNRIHMFLGRHLVGLVFIFTFCLCILSSFKLCSKLSYTVPVTVNLFQDIFAMRMEH